MKYLILLLFTFSFVKLSISQNLNIKISADKTIVEEEFPVAIKLESNKSGRLKLDLPSTFLKVSSTSGANQTTGKDSHHQGVTYYFVQFGYFKEEGKYKIKAIIEIDGKYYKSNTIRIKVVKKTPSQNINSEKEYAFILK